VVHSGQRFTLAMTFVWAGETMDVGLARLIKLARELGVRFKRLYCDQGFCSVGVLRLLRQRRVPYLIPTPARGGVARTSSRNPALRLLLVGLALLIVNLWGET